MTRNVANRAMQASGVSDEDVYSCDHLPPWEARDLSSVALLLDVDGTMLDLAATPTSVVVPPTLRANLETLHARCGGALALVSGRVIENLDQLFDPLRLPAIGGHGAQVRMRGDDPIRLRSAPAIGNALRKLMSRMEFDPRVVIEDKGTSLAVHYRLVPELGPALDVKLRAMVGSLGADALEVLHGKLVIEIKSARVNKGEAVRELMRHQPFAQRTPVFIGDDTTDQAVFRILPGLGGVGYSVERVMAGSSGMFRSPADVRAWLARLSCRGADV